MGTETIFILLFVVATAVAIAAQRLAVPYIVALVLTGLMLGLLNTFEAPHLTKALLFNIFLPGLLFEAAFHIEFKQFWLNRFAISALALPGVAAAIALTALILTPLADIDAQLLRIESGETNRTFEPKPSSDRADGHNPDKLFSKKIIKGNNAAKKFEEKK